MSSPFGFTNGFPVTGNSQSRGVSAAASNIDPDEGLRDGEDRAQDRATLDAGCRPGGISGRDAGTQDADPPNEFGDMIVNRSDHIDHMDHGQPLRSREDTEDSVRDRFKDFDHPQDEREYTPPYFPPSPTREVEQDNFQMRELGQTIDEHEYTPLWFPPSPTANEGNEDPMVLHPLGRVSMA